ncbi:flippase [Candidatus Uhrbacteria bacterium]|nr:flippase [Candidatus Uhrbacteria bacterium]
MVTRTSSLVQQTGIQVVAKAAGIGLGVAAIALLTRSLGREGYGAYATIMAYLQLFGIAVDLGLNVLAPTVLAETHAPEGDGEARNNFSHIFTMRLVAGVGAFAIAAAVAWVIPLYSDEVRVGIALATLSFLAIVLTQILQAPFQVAGRMQWPAFAEVVGRAVLVAGVACAAWAAAGLHAMVLATVVGNILILILTLVRARRIIPVRLTYDRAAWVAILHRTWPIALSILCNLVYLRADAVILSLLRPAADVGAYAAPYRLLDVLTQFPHMVMGLMLPLFAAAWGAGDHAQLRARLQHTFDALAVVAMPITVGAIVLGTPLMILISGPEFAVSGPVLGVLALALLGIFLGQPFGYAVVAVGAQRRMLLGYAVVAAVTLAGYLLLIPRYSFWGAAGMTVVSEVAIAFWTFVIVRRATQFTPKLAVAGCAALAALGMVVPLLLTSAWPVLIRIAIGAITYCVLLVVFPSTRQMMRAALDVSRREPYGA